MPKEIKKRTRRVENTQKETPTIFVDYRTQIENAKPPSKTQSISSTILQYFGIVVIGAIIYAICNYSVNLAPLSCPALLFFSLACAFTWVEVLKWGVTKPFTCVPCLTGWIALLFALVFHVDHWYFYLPAGLFTGALFESIKMKWL